MNLLLLSVLNRLAEKTRTFLSDPDADLVQWEEYMSQRSVLLLELETIPCVADDLASPAFIALKEEIARQEALVHEQALTKLARVGAELRTLAVGRRALQGYGTSSSPVLFERNI